MRSIRIWRNFAKKFEKNRCFWISFIDFCSDFDEILSEFRRYFRKCWNFLNFFNFLAKIPEFWKIFFRFQEFWPNSDRNSSFGSVPRRSNLSTQGRAPERGRQRRRQAAEARAQLRTSYSPAAFPKMKATAARRLVMARDASRFATALKARLNDAWRRPVICHNLSRNQKALWTTPSCIRSSEKYYDGIRSSDTNETTEDLLKIDEMIKAVKPQNLSPR